VQDLGPNWRSGFFRLWIGASVCWVILTAVMAYENVLAPHQKDMSDYNICVADHGLSACRNGLPFEESGPHLPNPYVPYVILAISGSLAILFACLGVAWIREGLKTKPDGPEA
jgi:hypothetical protein